MRNRAGSAVAAAGVANRGDQQVGESEALLGHLDREADVRDVRLDVGDQALQIGRLESSFRTLFAPAVDLEGQHDTGQHDQQVEEGGTPVLAADVAAQPFCQHGSIPALRVGM